MVVFLTQTEKYKGIWWFYVGMFLLLLGAAFIMERYAYEVDFYDEKSVETNNSTGMVTSGARIALTFDDGPSVYTESLLDGLRERGVHASFFILGENIRGREETLKRMQDEGHLIGNHTFHHVKLTSLSEGKVREEIEKTCNAIYEVTGYYTSFVRPPYGLWNPQIEYHVTMIPVLWSIDSLDWCTQDMEKTAKKVVSLAADGGIILMHDCYDTSVQAALRIVDELQKQGYEFVTVDKMIFD